LGSLFYVVLPFQFDPSFVGWITPPPLHFSWRGTPPLIIKKLMVFFIEGIYVHPFISPSRSLGGMWKGFTPPPCVMGALMFNPICPLYIPM